MSQDRGNSAAHEEKPQNCLAGWTSGLLGVLCTALLAGCTSGLEGEPLVEYSTEVNVRGLTPQNLTRQLRAGTYLLEVRERDIDLRVIVDDGRSRVELGDAYLRHGVHRWVVSMAAGAPVSLTLRSIDQRTWRGAAAVRILRWPQPPAGAPRDERLLGYQELGRSSALIAGGDKNDWQAAVVPLRAAMSHFQAAADPRALAEAEYQLAWVQQSLLYDSEEARRTAEAAESHFNLADDDTGVNRAAMLRAIAEFSVANTLGPEAPRAEQHELMDEAVTRLERARRYFAAQQLATDEINALNWTAYRSQVLGDYDSCAQIYQEALNLALSRGDRFLEAGLSANLGLAASRQGEASRAVALYERALPLIDRDRNPELYATLIANLGYNLVTLGEFDRALVLHSEALDLFMQRGDETQIAGQLTALAAIQFRSGNVERALATLQSALPLLERSRDSAGQISALRLAGNAAAELGQYDVALEYLRRAERDDRNDTTVQRTRVLIAGALRQIGDLEGAERKLTPLLSSRNEVTRADALLERARVRLRQGRPNDALTDLRRADALYARLKLDFDRIDTSSTLSRALLMTGDVAGATAAADTAIAIETRIRVNSGNPELRASFLAASYAPYEARIDSELSGKAELDPARVWRAFRVAESLRARSLADRLAHDAPGANLPRDEHTERLRETMTALQMSLERQLRRGGDPGGELLNIRRRIGETQAQIEARLVNQQGVRASIISPEIPSSLAEMQASLPDDTAVLAYFVGEQLSHGWLLTRTELRHETLPGRRIVENLINDFILRQRSGGSPARDLAVNPLMGGLLNGVTRRRLVVLPDGPLNSLPFAALPLPRSARELLVDRFVISTAPSLALALRPAAPKTAPQMRVAVIADPVYTPDDRRLAIASPVPGNFRGADSLTPRLARLPYSAIEARAVVQAFDGADVIELTGFNATARRVVELPSGDLDVLHFATHAQARRDAPEQSALFLSEYAADGSPLPDDRLTVEDITRSGLRADVVVLSGCATGDGRELRGEGVLGLAYAFMANGARTVVASLWPVEDAQTARFMEDFYSALKRVENPAEALQAAQLKSRARRDTVWASFMIRSSRYP